MLATIFLLFGMNCRSCQGKLFFFLNLKNGIVILSDV